MKVFQTVSVHPRRQPRRGRRARSGRRQASRMRSNETPCAATRACARPLRGWSEARDASAADHGEP